MKYDRSSDSETPLVTNSVISYMLRYSLITLLSILSLQLAHAQTLNEEQALEDISTLKKNFERFHSGLYRYTPRDSMDYFFRLVNSRLTGNIEAVDFYKEVTFLLNKVRCGHTRSSMPQRVNDAFKAAEMFLPLSVKFSGKSLLIDEFLTSEGNLKRGEEITAINGLSVNEINKRIFEHHSSDGFVNSNKYRLTERFFRYYYQLYVAPGTERYSLTIRGLDGKLRSETLTGEKYQQLQRLDESNTRSAELKLEHRSGYSYMRISTFGSGSLRNAGLDYEDFLEESFAALKQRGAKNLVLDLRGNGGGSDNYGATLVSYFADKPFKYFERIEVTDDYSGYGTVERREGRNLITSHQGLSTWQPQRNRFTGKVYVLTDGWSFSTCADVATVLHHNKWATFIGEETGGGYDGNTSGNSRTLTLPHSNIRINLPLWMYTTANIGHKYYGRGVLPDYPIVPSVDEFLKGEDVVLKKAEELMR